MARVMILETDSVLDVRKKIFWLEQDFNFFTKKAKNLNLDAQTISHFKTTANRAKEDLRKLGYAPATILGKKPNANTDKEAREKKIFWLEQDIIFFTKKSNDVSFRAIERRKYKFIATKAAKAAKDLINLARKSKGGTSKK